MKLTLIQFNQEYRYYKDDFDLELLMKLNKKTYRQLEEREETADGWGGCVYDIEE